MKTLTPEAIARRKLQIEAEVVAVFSKTPDEFSGMMTLIRETTARDLDNLDFHRFAELLREFWFLTSIQQQVRPERLHLLDWERCLTDRSIYWKPGEFI